MNPDALNAVRLEEYTLAVARIREHPIKTAEMVGLVVHRAHRQRINAARGPWYESQRAIGDAFRNAELGESFVTHVKAAEAVVLDVDNLYRADLPITNELFQQIASEDGGLLVTEEQREVWSTLLGRYNRRRQLLERLGESLTNLYVAEGGRMARIFHELSGKRVPLEKITMHLNRHLYHLIQQTLHLFQSHEAMLVQARARRAAASIYEIDEADRAGENAIYENESLARRWLDMDVVHMTEFAHLFAPYAAERAS